jgi:hypothetical protein
LRTLGLIDLHEKITPQKINVYDKVFVMPIPIDILRAIDAIVDKEIHVDPDAPPCTVLPSSPLQI